MSAFIRKSLFTLLFLFATVGSLCAQGVVKGTIVDATNGETLIGATVRLEGTALGATSDIDGNFTITNIPKGVYKIIVSYVFYKGQVFPNAVVENGKQYASTSSCNPRTLCSTRS